MAKAIRAIISVSNFGDYLIIKGKIIIDNCEKAEIQEINKNEFFESLKLQKLPYGFLL